MYRILLVEDDEPLRRQVNETLTRYGYETCEVTDFVHILERVEEVAPDLIILDINLPYYDGNYVCRTVRKKYKMPIIITSARNSIADQTLSLELGGDDYLIKPFPIEVLLSHISAALRRAYGEYHVEEKVSYSANGLILNEQGMKLEYQGKTVDLSKNEYLLLRKFLSAVNVVLTREELLEEIWDEKDFVDDNTLTVNVTRIKRKLEELEFDNAIKTKRSVGYVFEVLDRL